MLFSDTSIHYLKKKEDDEVPEHEKEEIVEVEEKEE